MLETEFLCCVKNLGRDNARTPMQWNNTKEAEEQRMFELKQRKKREQLKGLSL